jgi:hypothetical protein
VTDYTSLPSDLPAPDDDGPADHLAGQAMPATDGWDAIPGARGCTPEACRFRDHAGRRA